MAHRYERGIAVLEVSGLTKAYGKSMAIEDITFSAHAGEVVGIVGHNGCGKSTTLKLLTKIIYPDEGTIDFKEKTRYL